MSQHVRKSPQQLITCKSQRREGIATFLTVLVVGVSIFLSLNNLLSTTASMVIAYTASGVGSYWSAPPGIGFVRYLFRSMFLLGSIFLAVWYFPKELANRMPPFFAYSLPVLFIGITLYWVPLPRPGRTIPLTLWVISCIGFALLIGWCWASTS